MLTKYVIESIDYIFIYNHWLINNSTYLVYLMIFIDLVSLIYQIKYHQHFILRTKWACEMADWHYDVKNCKVRFSLDEYISLHHTKCLKKMIKMNKTAEGSSSKGCKGGNPLRSSIYKKEQTFLLFKVVKCLWCDLHQN